MLGTTQWCIVLLPETAGFNFPCGTEKEVIVSLSYKYVLGLCTLLLLTKVANILA